MLNNNNIKLKHQYISIIRTFFTTYGYLILTGLLLLLLGAGMTSEKGWKRTLTFLKTQPLTKSAIFLGKTSVSMLLAVGIALLSIICMVLLGTVSDRFGDWKFLVLYYDLPSVVDSESYTGFLAEEAGLHFIYMGNFLLETGALFVAGLVFLIALSLAVSLFFNNATGTLLTTLIIAVGGYVASSLPMFAMIAHWSPFAYLNVGKIVNGEMAIVLGNESVSTMPGLVALLVGAVLLVGAGMLWFRSKWMKVV